ncbi:hypothetical protein QYE76_022815 [Lolium multiflorum]|uniref:Retrotransposon gag domain-containing protein n=1 Tax=Lolium multiflorum TaxID=4521 RepID=A0AAD8VUF6_LOLMU|nr:hypothetical protein QYE76_022815 [Lolium multiflorum]
MSDKYGNGKPPPQAEFPKFDSLNPQLWIKACDKYFRVYSVCQDFLVEYATMHFIGNATLWFQIAEEKLGNITWEQLCDTLIKRFDRGQYQLLYRQVFKIRQETTVTEYIERFDSLMHHMLAYKPDLDPTFFTTRFVDGLHRDIKVVVLIQMPCDLETVVSLALLQEEIGEDVAITPSPYSKGGQGFRSNYKANIPQQISSNMRSKKIMIPEEKRSADTSRNVGTAQKLAALKAYRRAKNLCYTYGDKYSATHKCAQTVQLHVVEELMELLEGNESPESFTTAVDAGEQHEEFFSLSQQALFGTEDNSCFRLQVRIQDIEVMILIDSGSSGNFLNSMTASKLKGVIKLPNTVKVKISNGEILQGNEALPQCHWSCQDAQFVTDLKVIPLQYYDMILGIEWLKSNSPMNVDWQEKWMEVNQEGHKHVLHGLKAADTSSCLPVSSIPDGKVGMSGRYLISGSCLCGAGRNRHAHTRHRPKID